MKVGLAFAQAATGNVDFTDAAAGFASDLVAAVFFGGRSTSLNTSHADGSIALAVAAQHSSATTQFGYSAVAFNNQTTSNCTSWASATNLLSRGNSGTLGTVSAWLSNGVRVNFSAAAAADYFGCLLLGGSDIEAKVVNGAMPGGTPNNLTLAHGLGGSPDLIIAIIPKVTALDAASGPLETAIGFYDVVNGTAVALSHQNASGSNPSSDTAFSNTGIVGYNLSANSAFTVTSVTSSNVTVQVGSSSDNRYVALLCVRGLSGHLATQAGTFTTRTTTGSSAVITGMPTTPQAVLFWQSRMTALNSVSTNDSAGHIGLGVVVNAGGSTTRQGGTATSSKDAISPTIEHCQTSNTECLRVLDTSGNNEVDATLLSWDSGGITLNYSTVVSSALEVGYLAFATTPGAAFAGTPSIGVSGTGSLSTAIQAAASASAGIAASGALTNWATVTLTSPLYTGPGGILDPSFWLDVQPGVGSVLYYDATHITIYPNGEISSDTNNCSAVVQFFDGTGWSIGIVILTPQMVSYASVVAAAAATLSTGIQMAGAAISAASAAGNLTTGVLLSGNALAVAQAAAALTNGILLNSQALANVAASGALTGGQASLQGSAGVLSTALGRLTTQIELAGQVVANSTVAGGLSAQIVLSGAASSLAQASAQLSTGILLSGDANVVSSAAGAALLTTAFAGVANAVSTAMASLQTGLQVAGVAFVQTSGAGVLSSGISLAGGAVVDTAAAFNPPGLEAQFGKAVINIVSPTGFPVDLPVFVAGSACIATIEYFNAQGQPFVPNAVSWSVQDETTGYPLVSSTPITPELSNAITITGAENIMVSLSRTFEVHQLLFQIIDGVGQTNYATAEFEIVRKPGVN